MSKFDQSMYLLIKQVLVELSISSKNPTYSGDDLRVVLTIDTRSPGLIIPDYIREDFPDTVKIILQHQFYNMRIDDNSVNVTLSFKGVEENLVMPFKAIIGFLIDANVDFCGLQLGDVFPCNAPKGAHKENNVIFVDRFRKPDSENK